MALKIIFSDTGKTEQGYLQALETEEYYNGSSRRTLTFDIARDAADIEALDVLCSAEDNVARLELVNEEMGATNFYDGYVLKLKVGVEPKLIDPETQTYEDRVVLKLGKRTYIEQKLHGLGLL